MNGVPLPAPPKTELLGRPSYNEKIKKLVSAIKEARENGHWRIRDMVDYFNTKGIPAPSGGSFSYTTLHDILVRLEELRVIDGPRSISEAGSKRRYSPRLGTRSGSERGRYTPRRASHT